MKKSQGLNTSSKVSDVLKNGNVVWRQDLVARYPLLGSVVSLNSVGSIDTLEWRDNVGVVKPFSVNAVWQALRPREDKITWVDVVWFPNCIPRHAFKLWLIIKRKLKTQDLLRSWDVSGNLATNFPLCDSIPDSHAHLFFDYIFLKQVWNRVKDWDGLSNVAPSIDLIIDVIIPITKRRTLKCVISKLVVVAAAYFIWHERNYRLFKKAKRSKDQVVDCILSSVRLKLFSCRFM
ncbi:reverse transcriptase domain, reverse transcriptase zinc-binding domain protein [Tanacetum coccineum]